MSLHADASVQLVWAIANTEANFANDDRIRPVHLCIAVLKFCDTHFASQIKNIELSDEQRQYLVKIGGQTRHYLEMPSQEITSLRRTMRSGIRTGSSSPREIVMLHRSDESRNVFNVAASIATAAGSPSLTALHILQALFETGEVSLDGLKKGLAGADSKGARWRVTTDGDKESSAQDHGWPGRDLSRLARRGELAPFVGREKELKALASILSRSINRNALIVGEPGVGKTALVEGLALRLVQNELSKKLENPQILEIGGAQIAAACASAADLEARLLAVIHLGSRSENVILFIDDLYGLVPKHLDLVSPLAVLISGIADTNIPCIAATISTHYEHLTKLSPAFCRRFEPVVLSSPPISDSRCIGEAWMCRIAKAQNVSFQPDVLDEVMRFIDVLPAGRVMPDRLVNLLENTATFARVSLLASAGSSKNTLEITAGHVRSVLQEHYGVDPRTVRTRTSE